MRTTTAALFLALLAAPAFAADTEGTIASVDAEAMTITLEDGNTYKLPAEMDVSALAGGAEVVIAYRETDEGEKQITDLFLP